MFIKHSQGFAFPGKDINIDINIIITLAIFHLRYKFVLWYKNYVDTFYFYFYLTFAKHSW